MSLVKDWMKEDNIGAMKTAASRRATQRAMDTCITSLLHSHPRVPGVAFQKAKARMEPDEQEAIKTIKHFPESPR